MSLLAVLDHPALASVRGGAVRLLATTSAEVPAVEEIDAALSGPAGVRFVPQPPRPRRRRSAPLPRIEERYDGLITLRGEVPTRPGSVHDLMGALVWVPFPRSKRALHARQLRIQLRRQDPHGQPPPHRSRELDALALLDEGGVLLATPAPDQALLALQSADHDALEALIRRGEARGHVFGHALLEHVVLGRAGMPRAAVVVLSCPEPGDLGAVDGALCAWLEAEGESFQAPDPWPAVSLERLVGSGGLG